MAWKDRIKVAKRNGRFSDESLKKAQGWFTCAVGEFTEREKEVLKAYWNGYDFPISSNQPLWHLGYNFTRAVERNDIEYAQEMYDAIQEEKEKLLNASKSQV